MDNDTGVLTLTDFLLARIAEDEATARAAEHGPDKKWSWSSVDYNSWDVAQHGHRWSPERVLRECEAKRELVDDFTVLNADFKAGHLESTENRRFQALVAMSRAAAVYADHPDYRQEWTP